MNAPLRARALPDNKMRVVWAASVLALVLASIGESSRPRNRIMKSITPNTVLNAPHQRSDPQAPRAHMPPMLTRTPSLAAGGACRCSLAPAAGGGPSAPTAPAATPTPAAKAAGRCVGVTGNGENAVERPPSHAPLSPPSP